MKSSKQPLKKIGHQINRRPCDVKSRVRILKRTGGFNLSRKKFTLEEDLTILDSLVMPRVARGEQISEISLQKREVQHGSPWPAEDKAKELNREVWVVLRRWEIYLQPWLLQHYTGTLNLRVERMLANYINDNFDTFDKINWPEVAVRREFAGQTLNSLRTMYFKNLRVSTRKKFQLENDEVTAQDIMNYCELVYGKSRARLGGKTMERQRKVIAFFEKKVDGLGVLNFP